jgi:large conductance mechanosensitive channel
LSALKDFKAFILRGNVVDLAIGLVIGAAFGTVVAALVKDLLTPLIAAIGGQPNFGGLYFTINNSKFLYGDFINAIIAFIILAAVIFFLVVRPMNALVQRSHKEPPADPTIRDCPYCFTPIKTQATRCSYCTSEVTPIAPATSTAAGKV